VSRALHANFSSYDLVSGGWSEVRSGDASRGIRSSVVIAVTRCENTCHRGEKGFLEGREKREERREKGEQLRKRKVRQNNIRDII